MYQGNLWIEGAPSQIFYLFVVPVFSIIIWLIELTNYANSKVRIIHILFSWSSFFEIFLMTFIIWSLRHIERILGKKQFIIFLFYNFIFYLPFCIIFNIFSKQSIPLNLHYFYSYSLIMFMLAYIPSSPIFLILDDKLVITLCFILDIAVYAPMTFIPLITSILGTIAWSFGILPLSRFTTEPLEMNDDQNNINARNRTSRRHNRNHRISQFPSNVLSLNQTTAHLATILFDDDERNQPLSIREEDLRSMREMGFDENDARTALTSCRNDVQRAIDMLINAH